MSEKRRRRAVGPPGAPRPTEEPRVEREQRDDPRDLERYLAERPPHHEPR